MAAGGWSGPHNNGLALDGARPKVRVVVGPERMQGRVPFVLKGGPNDKHVQTAHDPMFVPQGTQGRPWSKGTSLGSDLAPLPGMGPLSPTALQGSMS